MTIIAPMSAPHRPYHVSIDWLSVSCDKTLFFKPNEEHEEYTLTDPGHGAKFWRSLRRIQRKRDKREVGVMCYDNTLAENANLVVIKFANDLLYDAECFEVVCDVILKLGLRYRGISRLDLACDFNTFNQGLLPYNLITGYLSNKYLKGGAADYMINARHQYFAFGDDTAQVLSERPILDQQAREAEEQRIDAANAELLAHGMPARPKRRPHRLLDVQPHYISSITWGSRSSGVQVQLYNKTLEMQQVAPKWHIVKTWQEAGLDTSRDVWRLEVRISTRGRELVNIDTGQPFKLNVTDLLIQEQVESIYFAYIAKYFKWYRNDGHQKLQNCKRLNLFNIQFVPIVKPKQYSRVAKSFNRTAKTIARNLEVHQLEQEAYGNTQMAGLLRRVSEYYRDVYKLGNWLKEQEVQAKLEEGIEDTLTPVHIPIDERYYSWAGLRAIAIDRVTEEYSRQYDRQLDHNVSYIDWDALTIHEQNVLALFEPRDEVPHCPPPTNGYKLTTLADIASHYEQADDDAVT